MGPTPYSRGTRALLAGCVLCFLGVPPASPAAEFFVAPGGTTAGNGSKSRPWDLATALAHPAAVKPGDTIWLDGGTYRGGFTSTLKGTPDQPITVRQAPGRRAVIDCVAEGRPSLLVVDGVGVTFWGFEVTCSDRRRVSATPGFGDLNRGGFHCRGGHVRFINLVVHDTAQAFGFWSEGEGGEIYGCLMYNNGWKGPDRGHGHGVYAQNKAGTKRILDNVVFNQFGYGVHVYGSSKAFLDGFHIEGNALFNNGSLNGGGERAPNLLVGGGRPASRIAVVENYTYHSSPGTAAVLGSGKLNEDLTLRGNYLHGLTRLSRWKKLDAAGNTFAGRDSLVELDLAEGVGPVGQSWRDNTYLLSGQKYPPFILRTGNKVVAQGWREWRDQAGFDKGARYVEGPLAGEKVLVRPNRYEPGRGHVIVYNWDRKDAVAVDLGRVVKKGGRYRLVSVQDYFGRPVLEGRYDGGAVRIPMKPVKPARPVGMEDFQPPVTGPEFDVFVVLPGDEK